MADFGPRPRWAPGTTSDSEIGRIRGAELAASLIAAAAQPERRLLYDFPDGAVLDRMPDLVHRLTADLSDVDVVLTHPFEGGAYRSRRLRLRGLASLRTPGSKPRRSA